MDDWDIALLATSGYIAVMALVRLMNSRRRQVLEQMRSQMTTGKNQRRPPDETPMKEPKRGDQAA